MRRPLAADAKIVRRPHDAAAEQVRPQMIDRHPRHQRIGRVDQPARQVEPIGAPRARGLIGGSTASVPGCTSPSGCRKSPRCSRWLARGLAVRSASTRDLHHRPARRRARDASSTSSASSPAFLSCADVVVDQRLRLARACAARRPRPARRAHVLRNAQQRIVPGDGHHAKPAQRVLRAVILAEHQLQPGVASPSDRLLGDEQDPMVAAVCGRSPSRWAPCRRWRPPRQIAAAQSRRRPASIVDAVVVCEFGGRRGERAKLAEHEIAVLACGPDRARPASRAPGPRCESR